MILDAKWSDRSTFRAEEVAEILNVSTWNIYEEIKKGKIPAIRVGRCLRVPRVGLEQLLAGTQEAA